MGLLCQEFSPIDFLRGSPPSIFGIVLYSYTFNAHFKSILLTILFISFQNSCSEPQDSTFEVEFVPEKDTTRSSSMGSAAESPLRLKLDIEVEHDFIEGDVIYQI